MTNFICVNPWHVFSCRRVCDMRRSGIAAVRRRPLVVALTMALLLLPARECVAQSSGGPPPAPAPAAPVVMPNNTATEAPATQPPAPEQTFTLRQAWRAGGWIMWILAGMAGCGVLLMLRQLIFSNAQSVIPRGLLTEMLDRVRAGELSAARRGCEERPCPLSAIALKAFDHLRHAPKAGVSLLRDTVEAEGARQADLMTSQAQLMLDIAVIAPMFGLLGTVLGLLQVFGPAATDPALMRAALQAGGIVQALSTTAFGLLVAIPAMACHAWLRRRTTRQIAALESAAAEIVMAVVGRYDR
ncbi:MAG: MotA/TolQ/ExbB proton channel family protein [bacterium]